MNFATQMSYSGIYVHGAPWSEWAQGKTNTSHGCINVTDADAQWFMNTVKRGDVIEVKTLMVEPCQVTTAWETGISVGKLGQRAT